MIAHFFDISLPLRITTVSPVLDKTGHLVQPAFPFSSAELHKQRPGLVVPDTNLDTNNDDVIVLEFLHLAVPVSVPALPVRAGDS